MKVANLTNRTDAFSTRDRSLDTFAIAKDSFKEAYMSHIQHVADSLPEGAVTAFLDKAYQSLDRIMEKTFDRRERALLGNGGHGKLAHRSMVKDANALALKSFTKIGKALLKDTATIAQARELTHSKTPTSGIVQRPRLFITGNGHINMVRTTPQPETLVFRGGGPRALEMHLPSWN